MSATIITTPTKKSRSSSMETFTRKSSSKTLSSACINIMTKTEATEMTELSDEFDQTMCKNVRFHSRIPTYVDLSHHDYTPEERKACWYDSDDYSCIQKDCVKQIMKMNKGEVLKDKKYCSRGLESHATQSSITKKQNRRSAVDAVLDEQEAQRQLRVVDEEAIADRYQGTASSCQLWARTIALRDQRYSEQYLDT